MTSAPTTPLGSVTLHLPLSLLTDLAENAHWIREVAGQRRAGLAPDHHQVEEIEDAMCELMDRLNDALRPQVPTLYR